MKLIKTYKFKLQPTESQKKIFSECEDTCRFLYNLALSQKIMAYEMRKVSVSKYDQYNQLPELKKEFTWIGNVYSDVLQEVLDRLNKSYDKFFKGGGFPKFAKKGEYTSFTYKRNFTVGVTHIKLPKIGEVKYFNSRSIIGTPKTATIKREGNSWFISITAEYETPFETIEVDNQNPIGIDMGVAKSLSLSDGSFISFPDFNGQYSRRVKILQRKLARQKKGSNSRAKTKEQLKKLYVKLSNQRLDYLHKLSTNLADSYSSIYIEDLKLQKMQQNGFKEVNKGMSNNGFSILRELLSYKMKEKGKHLGLVNPAYTSQTCSSCGTVDKKSRISQAEFVCTSCGMVDNADLNASKNILREGISQGTKRKSIG